VITDRDLARKSLLDASEVLEALRPSMSLGNPSVRMQAAWDIAKVDLESACVEYIAAWGPEKP
jgi:hypothetical protein